MNRRFLYGQSGHWTATVQEYPAFEQDSGPLQVSSQWPSSGDAENRNVCFYSLLDGR